MSGRKIELLSPAGDMERLKMSVLYGADAVYLAGTDFGMRSFAGNFTPDKNIRHTHEGSIGNLCNREICALMESICSGMDFGKASRAEKALIGR